MCCNEGRAVLLQHADDHTYIEIAALERFSIQASPDLTFHLRHLQIMQHKHLPASLWIAFLSVFSFTNGLVLDELNGLEWKPCDLDFPSELQGNITEPLDCATLSVPLDYTNSSSTTLQLQLIRANAKQQPARASVVFAPGGPGGSGVEEVARFGPVYRE